MKKYVTLLWLFACTCLLAQTPPQYMSADSLINMGITLYDDGNYDEALACFNRVNPNDCIPLTGQVSNRRAHILVPTGKRKPAAGNIQQRQGNRERILV